MKKINEQDYFKKIKADAELGYADALFELGTLYEYGEGVSMDPSEAYECYLLAAEQGHIDAINKLSKTSKKESADDQEVLAEYSEVEKDDAIDDYDKAIAGDADAQFNLACYYAENYDTGIKLELAVELYKKAAEQDHVGAQNNLGNMYINGNGVISDDKEAVKWYKKSAEQDHDYAQFNLGVMYANGRGVEKDDKEAVKWYTKAAEQENANAQSNLAWMYANGQGVLKDYKKAVKLYKKAAEQENANAQNNLAWMYANGQGVKKDDKDAFKWYTKAAEQENANAQNNLGLAYENGQGVKKDDKEAFKWYTKAAEQENANAQNNLGLAYENGQGVKKDDKKAVKWYTKAAKQNHTGAQNNLGWAYKNGQGVKKDDKKAVKWYTKAAEQGNANAQSNLGVMYANGRGVEKDDKEAVKWYTKAAEEGHEYAQFNLARRYSEGNGVTQDDKKAAKWYLKAAEKNFDEAQIKIGVMYLDGIGVLKDHKEATKWCTKSAEQGNTYAQYILYTHANDMNIDTKESIDWLHKSAGIDILSSAKYDFKRAKNFNREHIKSYMKLVYKGYAKSQYLLGTMYYEKADARDIPKSKYWIKKAYENSDKDIRKKAEEFWNKNELWNYKDYKYKKIDEPSDVEKIRNIGNQALTPEEILLRAIMNANDSFVIGEAYMYSKIILRDPLEAIKYYKDAAEYDDRKGIEQGGNDEAKYKLGVLYYEENSVKDFNKSKYWINKAYEGADTEISKKAEDYWNKHELWNH